MDNKIIFWCKKCNSAYGGELGIAQTCPDCHIPLIETDMPREQWRTLSDSLKERYKAEWKLFYVNNAGVKQKVQDKYQETENRINLIKNQKNHMLTTGYNFEGYKITKYLGIVTGETVLGTGLFSQIESDWSDFFGEESTTYNNKLQQARDIAKSRAIYQSALLGGNALIGVDIDYINFASDKIGVIYNGTSVVVEKI